MGITFFLHTYTSSLCAGLLGLVLEFQSQPCGSVSQRAAAPPTLFTPSFLLWNNLNFSQILVVKSLSFTSVK
jgi:hypothetical protein